MSNLYKGQLDMVFQTEVLSEVSQTEVLILASWLDDILLKIGLDEDSQPKGLMK